ncbi:unnamed protein product [Ectocarpus fasciculatus]
MPVENPARLRPFSTNILYESCGFQTTAAYKWRERWVCYFSKLLCVKRGNESSSKDVMLGRRGLQLWPERVPLGNNMSLTGSRRVSGGFTFTSKENIITTAVVVEGDVLKFLQ